MNVIMKNPKELFDDLIQTMISSVSETLIGDAIELYAKREIVNDDDREEFLERYSNELLYTPIIKKAVLDVVLAIIAASRAYDDAGFNAIVDMLELEEQDDVIHQMKLIMLRKMAQDPVLDMDDLEEKRFRFNCSLRAASVRSSLG
ncbi:MAG: hypothetical protein ON057_000256 [Glomeribacter sp. 1016415]|nr:hypothetical protein [Glomeribacter sp. 1016415]